MYELKIITQFGAAHQLRNYDGKCENLHGHNWKIEVYVKGEELDKDGMLIDFKILKDRTEEIIESFDHKFLNDLECFSEINPSSENIARWIYESIRKKLKKKDCTVSSVTVWENDTSSATYYE